MHHIQFHDPAGAVQTGEQRGDSVSLGDERYGLDEIDVFSPYEPSKIVCIGHNYAEHAEKRDEEVPDHPLLFLKPPNAVAGHGDTVTFPAGKEQVEYETELAVVIGRQCRNTTPKDATEVIAGCTVMNDVSNHDDQDIETNWVHGETFDDSAPLGPVLAGPDHLPDDTSTSLRVNSETRQNSSVEHLVFSIPNLIAEITTYMTFEADDVISTGTPEGVGSSTDGDTVEVGAEGVGILKHRVRQA